jgi:hypothetical protein
MHACGCAAAPPFTDLTGDPGLARLARLAIQVVGGYVDARQALGRARRFAGCGPGALLDEMVRNACTNRD